MSRYYNDFSDTHDEALEHYGVLGMKWGVRKYVDENGRLTAAGRKKYGSDPSRMKPKYQKYQMQKYSESMLRGEQGSHVKAVNKVAERKRQEYEKTPEAKNLKKSMNDAIQKQMDMQDKWFEAYDRNDDAGMANALYKEEDAAEAYSRARDKYTQGLINSGRSLTTSYKRAHLRDMGYEDTEAGMKFIENLMDWDNAA